MRFSILRDPLQRAIPCHLILELADLRHYLVPISDPLLYKSLLPRILEGLGLEDEEMARVMQLIDDTRNDNRPSADDRVVSRAEFSK